MVSYFATGQRDMNPEAVYLAAMILNIKMEQLYEWGIKKQVAVYPRSPVKMRTMLVLIFAKHTLVFPYQLFLLIMLISNFLFHTSLNFLFCSFFPY